MTTLLGEWRKKHMDKDEFVDEMVRMIGDYLLTGGKFHRPLLTRLAYSLFRKADATTMQASQVMEIFHRFLLMHDDILDTDLRRHGMPTMQAQYKQLFASRYPNSRDETFSMGMQLVGGDLVNALAYELMATLSLEEQTRLTLIRGLYRDTYETCAGWILETNLKHQPLATVALEEVEKAMILVSAQYSVVWPLRFGQLLAGKGMDDWDERLETYGLKVGLAFQLRDDILGVFGKTKHTGKPVGSDIREGKKSMLLVRAFGQTSKSGKLMIQRALGKELREETLHEVQAVIEQSGALEWAKKKTGDYVNEAVAAIEPLKTPPEGEGAKQRLIQLAYFLADREL